MQKRALPGFHLRSKIPRSDPYNLALTAYLPRTYDALISHLSRTKFCLRFRLYYIHSI